jgi:hypothetical protein
MVAGHASSPSAAGVVLRVASPWLGLLLAVSLCAYLMHVVVVGYLARGQAVSATPGRSRPAVIVRTVADPSAAANPGPGWLAVPPDPVADQHHYRAL